MARAYTTVEEAKAALLGKLCHIATYGAVGIVTRVATFGEVYGHAANSYGAQRPIATLTKANGSTVSEFTDSPGWGWEVYGE